MAFRFVHTADIHLDSPLRSLALRNPALADVVGTATRTAFQRIIDLCLTEAVDALLIAGDLYDGSQTSMKTAGFLARQLQRLDAAGIAVFVIRGNHDAMSRITRELVLPPVVHVFGPKAGVVMIDGRGPRPIAVHGISFAQPQAPDSLLPRFGAPVSGAVNIGLLHTSLNGAEGHDPYAPCSVADLQASGFDYWALGHIHQRSQWNGRTTVVMPGTPQGRDIGEAGAKTASLVTVADDGTVQVEQRPTGVVQFERAEVALNGLTDWDDLIAALRAAVQAASRRHRAEHLVLRPRLSGQTPLYHKFAYDLDMLLAEAELAAESSDQTSARIWIDKIEVGAQTNAAPVAAGAMADLAGLLASRILPAPELAVEATAEIDALLRALPKDLRALLARSERGFPPLLAALCADQADRASAARDTLLAEGTAQVLAQISGEQG